MRATAAPKITDLKTLKEFQDEHASVFPSATSLEWYIKRHRGALRDAQALVVISGRRFVVPDRFVRVVLKVGAERAARA